jgi:hypothetical protein
MVVVVVRSQLHIFCAMRYRYINHSLVVISQNVRRVTILRTCSTPSRWSSKSTNANAKSLFATGTMNASSTATTRQTGLAFWVADSCGGKGILTAIEIRIHDISQCHQCRRDWTTGARSWAKKDLALMAEINGTQPRLRSPRRNGRRVFYEMSKKLTGEQHTTVWVRSLIATAFDAREFDLDTKVA